MTLFATTSVVTLVSDVRLIHGLPVRQVAFETTASLVTSLAGFLVFSRLRRNPRLNELALIAALAVIALSNVLFVTLPMLLSPATVDPAMWSAVVGWLAGTLLFAVAAFVPGVRLRRPRRAQGLTAIGVLGILVLTAALPRIFGSGLAQTIMPSAGPYIRDASPVNTALAVVQIVAAVLALTAAAGFLRRFERLGAEFSGWLAIAAILAAASHVDYAFNPAIYSPQVSLGGILRCCCCVALLAGSMREICSFWHTLASAAVAEERRRIARDLHDGLSQELAYLGRNLSGLQGTADEETLHRLQVSIDRARLASRQAIDMITTAGRPVIADALTEAAGEVANRFDLNLSLDLASGIGMAPARTDALVRIACEALTNVARHSGSRQVSVVLRRYGAHVRMLVRDSGGGFDATVCRGGFGITSMRERARSVGGELRISSEPGAGSQVEATL